MLARGSKAGWLRCRSHCSSASAQLQRIGSLTRASACPPETVVLIVAAGGRKPGHVVARTPFLSDVLEKCIKIVLGREPGRELCKRAVQHERLALVWVRRCKQGCERASFRCPQHRRPF